MSKSGDAILRAIRGLVEKGEYERYTDRDLLRRFAVGGDEAAFAALMRRHGPMVMGVALRVLRHHQDAEDVCQGTFLLLVRKAKTTTWRESIANWLYEAAYRLSLKARESAKRRSARERKAQVRAAPETLADITLRELQTFLDEELARLPKKYRAPVILCCLEGKSRDETARCLGVPLSTVISRLLEGRELLRRRLAARGLALSLAFAGFSLVSASAHAALPPGFAAVTSRVAVQVLANGIATSGLSPKVLSLVQGGTQAMWFKKVKIATAVILAVCLAAGGTAKLAQSAQAQNPGKASQPPTGADKQAQPKQSTTVPQAKKADAPEARQPLKEAREAADAVKDPQWKAWLLEMIGAAEAKSGNKAVTAQLFQDAIRAAKEIKGDNLNDPSPAIDTTLNGIACAQASAGDVATALQTLKAIENEGRREQSLADVARFQARSGDIQGALKTAETLSDSWKDHVLAQAAALLADSGDLKEALRVMEGIANEEERMWPLTALARAQFKKKDVNGAQKTLQSSQEIVGRMNKDQPGDAHTVALATVAGAQADTGDLKGARQTIDAIKDARWKGPALGHLAVAQAELGLFKESLDTLGDIEHDYHLGEALTNIVKAQLRERHFQRAQETAGTINNVSWSVNAWVEIAVAEAKAGDRASALKSLKKAIDNSGLEGKEILDDEPNLGVGGIRNATLSLIARTKVQMGDEEEAFAWARKQATPELRVLAFIRIAEGIELRKADERAGKK